MGEVGVQTDIAAWLLEQIAEDEAGARSCGGAPWVDQIPPMVHVDPVAIREAKWQFGQMGYVASVEHDHDRAHIARWDPARVLVECDTKRKRVALHSGGHECSVFDQNDEVDSCRYVHEGDHCSTLLLEAQPFADRAGFREEWRSVQITW